MSHAKIAHRAPGQSAPAKNKAARKPAWQAVFATEEDYDKSVASVVARIKSGEVLPRVPDSD